MGSAHVNRMCGYVGDVLAKLSEEKLKIGILGIKMDREINGHKWHMNSEAMSEVWITVS